MARNLTLDGVIHFPLISLKENIVSPTKMFYNRFIYQMLRKRFFK